jgi:serine/threonine protein kinase
MGIGPPTDDLIVRLPLPLAQLYRRALNAKTPVDRHHNAFYLAEATLKLAACLRIGIVLAHKVDLSEPLIRSLEALCMPSIGQYVSFLRDVNEHLLERPDAALLPLAAVAGKLAQPQPLPAVKAFAERATRSEGDEQPPLTRDQVRDSVRQGVLGFFNLVAAYRNQVFGHGAHRSAAYYEEAGSLLLEAAAEVLRQPVLFGGLILAVTRLEMSASQREPTVVWQGLIGAASLPLAPELAAAGPAASRPEPGHLHFVEPGVRVSLHPLVVYQEDRTGRERVGFLNRAITRKVGSAEEVRRCEYLDYATGDPLRDIDARQELTRLLATLRGKEVAPAEVDRLIASSQAESEESALASPSLTPGAVIGDFELEGELGRGGMGVVYRARQRSLNRKVALKVLPPALAADPVALARFRREIAALARCDHPNMVKILTSGSDGDRHFYAMELVEGTDLADLFAVLSTWSKASSQTLRVSQLPTAISSSCDLARRRREAESEPIVEPPTQTAHVTTAEAPAIANGLPSLAPIPAAPPSLSEGPALAVRIGEMFGDVADALAHLHERGVLHRDIKPGNLMLTQDGRRLLLMDLGLARLEGDAERMTRTRQFLGTLRYASPEQVHSATAVDARSDVYSLGATLWEMLALAPIYGADVGLNDPELVRRIQFDEAGRIRNRHREVPEELEAISLQCLEKDPRRRYASARELADDLGRWRRGERIRARRLTPAYRLRRFLKRQRRTLAIATVALFAVVIGYVLLADAGMRIVGSETVRRFLDRHEMSLLRPAPAETALCKKASDLRVFVGQKLLASTALKPGWWDASLQVAPGAKPYFDAWTQAQTNAALEMSPETGEADREILAGSLLELFDGWKDQMQGFNPKYGFQLFRSTTTERPYPTAIGTAWVLPALAAALGNPKLDADKRTKLEERLTQLQEALDNYQILDKEGHPIGAWRVFVDQENPAAASLYVTTTMLLGLLEAKKANLSWRGDRARLQQQLHDAETYVISQFDGRGWQVGGPTGRMELNDGLTLWLFALLLRAEAEDGLKLPEAIANRIPVHLAECWMRPPNYPDSLNSITLTFTFEGKIYREETRVVRVLWHPWSTETASLWLQRCNRNGAPLDEIVEARRVLGHLIIDLGPQIESVATAGATFVPTEMLIGLAAVPPP